MGNLKPVKVGLIGCGMIAVRVKSFIVCKFIRLRLMCQIARLDACYLKLRMPLEVLSVLGLSPETLA